MCILCVASRWSRRIVTMLPWLIIPLIILWALSQLLPPGFRFEVTSPRLACVGVLLFSLGWYELLMPRLSEWRAKRNAMLHEKRKIEAQEAAKWRKEAIRKCRNCDTPYKDQNPAGGKFMCTYCGHLSKRPALDIPGGQTGSTAASGLAQFFSRKDLRTPGNRSWTPRMFENNLWPGVWGSGSSGGDGCVIGQNSGMLIFFRLVSLAWYCAYLIGSKLSGGGMSGGDRSRSERKGGQRKGEDGNCQESRAEKLKRKAEEKRLAKLEKEQIEEEERKQREEVARLVDERRKQKQRDAQKENDNAERQEAELKKQGNTDKARPKSDTKCSKAKKDNKKPDDCSPKVVKPPDAVVKSEEVTKPIAPPKSFSSKMTSAIKPAAYPPFKYHPKARSTPAFVRKLDKPFPTTVAPTKVSPDDVVTKPSAWNRISWAWGKGNNTKEQTTNNKDKDNNDDLFPELASKDTAVLEAPKLPPSPLDEPPVEPAVQTNSYFGGVEDIKNPSSLSAFSAPFPSPTKPHYTDNVPDSLYSTFMSPPAATLARPALDPWGGSDLLPKSTWQMWDAPNLELPRLTQALASPPVVSTQQQRRSQSLLSSSALSTSVVGVPSLPISNNDFWPDVKRIWTEGTPPPEFVDETPPPEFVDETPPPEFVDCITHSVMRDPVIAADGHSYERNAIEQWLLTHDTSPKTGEVLPQLGAIGGRIDKSLRPNHNLRGQIIEYRESLQRGSQLAIPNSNWHAATEGLLSRARFGGLPGAGSVWAYNSA